MVQMSDVLPLLNFPDNNNNIIHYKHYKCTLYTDVTTLLVILNTSELFGRNT